MQQEHEKNNPYHKCRVCLEVHSSDDERSRIDEEPMHQSADERQVCAGKGVIKWLQTDMRSREPGESGLSDQNTHTDRIYFLAIHSQGPQHMWLTCRFPLSINSARRCASYPCHPRCWLLNFVLVMMWIFFFFFFFFCSVAWRTTCPWFMQVFEMEMEQCHNELGLTGNSFPVLLLITWSNNLKHLMYLKDKGFVPVFV